MSMQIERRVSALERHAKPDNMVDTIVWCVIDPQNRDAEMVVVTGGDGECWTRLPRETEDQFIERAQREVARDARGFAQLIADSVVTADSAEGSTPLPGKESRGRGEFPLSAPLLHLDAIGTGRAYGE